jgi:hypothetical protein
VSSASTPHHNDIREIAELLAWCRRLTAVGPDADPDERSAYFTTKTELLTRITEPDPHHSEQSHDREEHR